MGFRDIGKHLPRTKRGEGWVEKRGQRRKVWVGFWYEYALTGESERRRTREKVLGTVKEIGDSRPNAMASARGKQESDPHEEHDLPLSKKTGERYHPRQRRAVSCSISRERSAY